MTLFIVLKIVKIVFRATIGLLFLTILPWALVQVFVSGKVKTVDQAAHRPVGIVFGASVQPDGQPSDYLARRLDVAAELYRQGKVDVLLVSGDNRDDSYNEPKAMAEYLVKAGVPSEYIIQDKGGVDTNESCLRAHEVYGISEATLITQGYHLRRAIASCEMAGISSQGVRKEDPLTWMLARNAAREVPATWKLAFDYVSGRDVANSESSTAVTDALAAKEKAER